MKTIQKDSGFTKGCKDKHYAAFNHTMENTKLAHNKRQGGGTMQIWLHEIKRGGLTTSLQDPSLKRQRLMLLKSQNSVA